MEIFNPNNQQKYREADYINGMKTVVTIEYEIFLPYPFNPRYLVSTYGTIYDLLYEKKLVLYRTPDGYLLCYLDNGRELVHRMVAYTFLQNVPHYGEVVNHLNENKTWNLVDNLTWCTNQQNVQYSVDRREEVPEIKNLFSDDQKRYICYLLQEGKSTKEIAQCLNKEYTKSFIKLISKVRRRERWADISKDFEFPNVQYTENEIREFCKLLEQGYNGIEIANICNIPYTQNFASLLSSIRNGRLWKSISQDYNISPVALPEVLVDQICSLLNIGYSPQQIATELHKEYTKEFAMQITFIKTGRCYREISSKYPEVVKMYTVDEQGNLL